ncbi:DUF3986 family protein [Pontibacillus sp. ALD_SL1]|uniref:DUF3986 family protein n=1 Tax=Pontibacillus sp. ALD_SL1 TaxID=2777185 RepID=UPI001A97B8DC|nr:DUF3986 family protein [Pontibacillus sp. ALD_SL1]QST01062.1 DUF3986 family protein [Pontibacillus sp. ALD_SL1]
MEDNKIYIGYYKNQLNLEAVGLWNKSGWRVFLSEDDQPKKDHYLFTATSIDEAYDYFYEWVDQYLVGA